MNPDALTFWCHTRNTATLVWPPDDDWPVSPVMHWQRRHARHVFNLLGLTPEVDRELHPSMLPLALERLEFVFAANWKDRAFSWVDLAAKCYVGFKYWQLRRLLRHALPHGCEVRWQ